MNSVDLSFMWSGQNINSNNNSNGWDQWQDGYGGGWNDDGTCNGLRSLGSLDLTPTSISNRYGTLTEGDEATDSDPGDWESYLDESYRENTDVGQHLSPAVKPNEQTSCACCSGIKMSAIEEDEFAVYIPRKTRKKFGNAPSRKVTFGRTPWADIVDDGNWPHPLGIIPPPPSSAPPPPPTHEIINI